MKTRFALILFLLAATALAAPTEPASTEPALPRRFTGHAALFRFIAAHEDFLPTGEAALAATTPAMDLMKLAAESTVTIAGVGGEIFHVIESHYYVPVPSSVAVVDRIRGAQNNGNFYLLRATLRADGSGPLELVGIISGNGFRWETSNGVPIVVAGWHMSAAERPESRHRWNSRLFVPSPDPAGK